MRKKVNNFFSGDALELWCSQIYHSRGTPLLISSRLLRRRGCGQVDVALFNGQGLEKKAVLVECKSSGELSCGQYRRLQKSAELVGYLFRLPTVIRIFSEEFAKSSNVD